jgi:hypothetical protein
MRAGQWARLAAVPAFVAAWMVAGCGKDSNPTKPGSGGGPPTYPVLSTPQDVLMALEQAYSLRDSTEAKALYDSSYTGTSKDFSDPGSPTLSFTYVDEVRHAARLAKDPTVTSAHISLGPSSSWTRLGSDDPTHPEWAVIQIAGSQIDIQVEQPPDTWQISGSSEFFEFMFKPSTPESTSPTDTLWKIIRWEESRAP